MIPLTVKFYNRSFEDKIQPVQNATLKVQYYSHRAIGGPYEARIEVQAGDLELWEFLEYLRRPVELITPEGDAVWWGYVSEVEVIARNPYSKRSERVRVGASLDSMFNRVAVAWEDIVVGTYAGPRETTDWADDSMSQDEYGIKEGLFSGESASDQTLAEAARDILLEQKKFPIPIIDLNAAGDSKATIFCRGWWETMAWKYGSVPATLAFSSTNYDIEDAFGTVAIEQLAQSIHITGGDINAYQVKLRLGSYGAPTDNVTVDLYSATTSGSLLIPDTLIASASVIAGTSLSAAWTIETFTFTPAEVLSDGADYFLVIGRSGAMDNVNYYKITIDSLASYSGGSAVSYNGAAWGAETYDWYFEIYANALVETSTQIINMIVNFNQFFQDIDSDIASGIVSESFRDGDGTAKYEIEQLLQHGTTNLRRMLIRLDQARNIYLYEEPERLLANMYSLYTDGSLLDPDGAPVRKTEARAGFWAQLVDVIPSTLDVSYLGNTIERFIEITEYNSENDKTFYTARDELDPFEVGRPIDG